MRNRYSFWSSPQVVPANVTAGYNGHAHGIDPEALKECPSLPDRLAHKLAREGALSDEEEAAADLAIERAKRGINNKKLGRVG